MNKGHSWVRFSVFSPLSTYLPERARYLPEKGTTEANNKGPKALSSSKQRGIEPSAKQELELVGIFGSLIWMI